MEHYGLINELFQLAINYFRLMKLLQNRQKRFRRWWSKPLIRNNFLTGYGSYLTVFTYFKLHDEEEFIQLTRMNIQAFVYLFNLVEDKLTKNSRRRPLPAELRLCLVLNYLAHSDSLKKNAWFYAIGESTIKKIIPEVCHVLCEVMLPIFVAFPSAEELQVISHRFKTDLHFPNCFGAVDGRHCPIQKPRNSASMFWNYKKFYSVVLMACCDSNKRFIWVNVGDYGSYNDAGIFSNSDLGQGLQNATINLPRPTILPDTDILCPYYLIGDGGFPIKNYLMKPFLRSNGMTVPQKIFNYRLSHARSVIENAFGILSKKWLINQYCLAWKLPTCQKIILSTVCLHNFLLDFENNVVNRPYNIEEIQNVVGNNEDINENNVLGLNALTLRRNLADYFVSPRGSVPFQWDKI